MGCGCKDNNVNEIIEKGPITFKSVLNKSISTIMWVLLLTILTPFIVILIWYYVIGSVYGGNINTLNLLLKYIKDNVTINRNKIFNYCTRALPYHS